jgi:hypothetical protein
VIRGWIIGLPEDGGSEAGNLSEMSSGTTVSSTPVAGEQFIIGRNRETLRRQYDGKTRKLTYVSGTAGGLIQVGKVSFGAGVTSVIVTFPEAFAATPYVYHTIEAGTGVVQAGGTTGVSTTQFTATRSAAAGAVTGHWWAIGQQV